MHFFWCDKMNIEKKISIASEDYVLKNQNLNNLLQNVSNETNLLKKCELVNLASQLMNKKQVEEFFKKDKYLNLKLLSIRYPEKVFELLFHLDFSFEEYEETTLNEQHLIFKVQKSLFSEVNTNNFNSLKSALQSDQIPLRFKIFILDRFDLPGDMPNLLNLYLTSGKKIAEDEVNYAITSNIARRNVNTLRKLLTLKDLPLGAESTLDTIAQIKTQDNELSKIISRIFQRQNYKSKSLYEVKPADEQKIADIKEVYQYEGTDAEFLDYSLKDLNPDCFYSISRFFRRKNDYDLLLKLSQQRLNHLPNSISAAREMINVYDRAQMNLKVVQLIELINTKIFNVGDILTHAQARAKIGDWDTYNKYLNRTIAEFHRLGSSKATFSNRHMFFIEAANDVDFALKAKIFQSLSLTKDIRKPLTYRKNLNKKIGVFSGDFRLHAMTPVIEQFMIAASELECELIPFATFPENMQDEKTREFKERYNLVFIDHRSSETLKELRDLSLSLAVDLSQNTQFNCLNLFREGIAQNQITASWASGFSSGTTCFDGILVDQVSFENVAADQIVERMLPVRHGGAFGATQELEYKPTNRSGMTFALFMRPLRYSEQLLNTAAALIKSFDDLRCMICHPSLSDQDLRQYILSKLTDKGVSGDLIEISDEPLRTAINKIDFVLDSFPVCSPTVSKDCLSSGIPCFSREGSDPFTRFSYSWLQSMELNDFIWTDIEDLLQKVRNLDFYRDQLDKRKIEERLVTCQELMREDIKKILIKCVGDN